MCKSICERIIRYCRRGFTFLEPQDFDDTLYTDIMGKTHSEETREETKEMMDIDGEIQVVTVTYRPCQWPLPSIDAYQLQEAFIKRIDVQTFK